MKRATHPGRFDNLPFPQLPFNESEMLPSIIVGAFRHFWHKPTASEITKTPTGIIQRLVVKKSLSIHMTWINHE
ncbi:MAG: hypothetical protein LUQ47_02950 [Methanotrichaceae archaeon]|nr:hypothetical protein [Methanotrichaceae archaeon]